MGIEFRGEFITPDDPHLILERSKTAGTYLLYCFDNIMNLTLLEAGDITLDIAQTSLEAVAREVVDRFGYHSAYHKRTVQLDIATDSTSAAADAARIDQIITHLVDNALRFSDPQSKVIIRIENQNGTTIRVSVRDSGIGIPQAVGNAIFESFQQAENSHTRSFTGLGLGLTVASGLVDLHESRLAFTSEEGHGSTFYFELPLIQS